ncbi:RNA-binding domain-containing protein [Pediococcus pentosaceus]|uniref:RNA-binding domain-containing protein n=1 Tax=Pediococcus pentosaceus TaxID=1255 RepID=UPI00201837F6|nr:RNA-binding domain-containing protein [Pediococcus pentosaceus]MCL3858658.1 putative DNA binding domain-containing protein [Pediococcus pentosaceus]
MNYSKKLPDEDEHLEYKANASKLSSDIWETISAFENTDGGLLILGVEEIRKNGRTSFTPCGLKNPQAMLDIFWSTINNKVSESTITNNDISIIDLTNDLSIIEINVHPILPEKRPVFLNGNVTSTFFRKGATDLKATSDELKILIRNADDQLDTQIMDGYSADDLEMDDVQAYRKILISRPQYSNYAEYDISTFLEKIGVISKKYDGTADKGITAGGLLFFGKNNAILHKFPYFQLDFFDKTDPSKRWIKRISSIEDNLNIFSFFTNTMNYISSSLKDPFELNNQLERIDTEGSMQVALREALLNMLMHADYYSDIPLETNSFINYYEFVNPGQMKIPSSDFFTTNRSRTRNAVISKLFVQMGRAERAGHGGTKIYEAAQMNNFREPKITTNLRSTTLAIWKVDYADSFSGKTINDHERTILKHIVTNGNRLQSRKDIEESTKLTRSIVSRNLLSLLDKEILIKVGTGRTTKYTIAPSDEQLMAQMQMMPNLIRNMINRKS